MTATAADDPREALRRAPEMFDPHRPLTPVHDGVPPRPASVLILFSERHTSMTTERDPAPAGTRDLDLLLQVRASTLQEHPGQVSFPGGRQEPWDADPVQTALREASEETGLDPAGVEILSVLPVVPLPVSNHLVTPVIGWWNSPGPGTLAHLRAMDPGETTRVWQASVSELLDPQNRFTAVLHRGGSTFHGPAFDVQGTVVWGFTAIVLDGVFTAVGWTRPWDIGREREIAA
jgi:8-oxo-dGTP pyrophosphatase MutT (NUDIX family)